jgi:molecular chaperone GrpE (heat shock protein)
MKNWLRNLLQPSSNPPASEMAAPDPASATMQPQANNLSAMNELQALRMEQASSKRTVENLTQEIERLRSQQEELVHLTLANELEGLYKDMSAPASQVLTQAHLIESQGKVVQAQDVLAVARRLVRAMERHGAVFEGKVGETVQFDPGKHISIQPGQVIGAGKAVIVRFCGVSYGGKILYKAIVEQEPACRED